MLAQQTQKTPLVLIHGWGFDHHIWQSIQIPLSHHFQVITLDLPGYGELASEKADSLDHIARFILPQIPKQSLLLGWSFGGLVAATIANLAPDKVSKIIYLASSPQFLGTPAWPGIEIQALRNFRQRVQQQPQAALQQFCQWLTPQVSQRRLRKQLFANRVQSVTVAALLSTLDLLIHSNLRALIQKLTCPQLFIYGEQDPLIPIAQQQRIQKHFPTKVLSTSGHIPFLSHPDEFMVTLSEVIHAEI